MKKPTNLTPFDWKNLSISLHQLFKDDEISVFVLDHLEKLYEVFPSIKSIHQSPAIDKIKHHIKADQSHAALYLNIAASKEDWAIIDSFSYQEVQVHFIFMKKTTANIIDSDKAFNELQTEYIKIKYLLELYFKNSINEQLHQIRDSKSLDSFNELTFMKTHNAVAFADADGYILKVNEAWTKLHAYEHIDELIGQHLSIFHSKEQLENEVRIINDLAIKNGVETREVGHINAHGKSIPTMMTVIRLENESKEFSGFVAIATDISEQKSTEERLKTIIESVEFGIVIIDPENFEIIEMNTAAIQYIGLNKNEIIGKTCHQFICPNEKNYCPVKDLKYKVNNYECFILNSNGHRIPILKTVNEINLGGKPVFIESFIDISKQREAQKKAEESDKLKTAFLSNISHELRTPLNHILGFTSLVLEDDDISETYKEYLGIVKRSGNNLLRIIEDIVTISKIEAGHHVINEDNINLKQLLYNIFTKYQSEIQNREKQVKLIFEDHAKLNDGLVVADEMKIKQVVENLISNAIKYTEIGYVNMQFQTIDKVAEIKITDTGKGIHEDSLPHIFESFRQMETEDRKIYDGTGIGLTICKSLSNMLGGNIEVESEVNVGSTFTFTFPFKEAMLAHEKSEGNPIKAIDLTGKTILIVEDEKINYLYLKTLLQPTHAQIIWKQNGQEAVDFFKSQNKADGVLMDMQMPIMDGYEATLKIRRIDPNVPIIAQTANVMADDRRRCLNLGCNEYTTKPIQQDVLFWHLNRFIK